MPPVFPSLLILLAAAGAPAQHAASVFARVKGSVVTIKTPTGAGTGFLIGEGNLLVTSYHVIEGDAVSELKVSLARARVAYMVAADEQADVAILRLTTKAAKGLSLHAGPVPTPGSKVFVIGTPLGFLSHTISEGIVRGIRRSSSNSLLQITAPISPGSSGSPVLDSSGRVVAMVQGSIEAGQALNFAVSAADIRRVLSGAATRPSAPPTVKPLVRKWGWPAGNPRLADIASKLGLKDVGDEAARKLAKEGARAVPFLIAAFSVHRDDYWAVSRAVDALDKIGKPAVEPLIRALSVGDEDVRKGAAEALGQIGDAQAVGPLIRALSDRAAIVRRWAVDALGQIGDTRAVEPLIRALSDGDEEGPPRASVSGRAVEVLVRFGAPAVEPLARVLSAADPDVRLAPAWALGEIKDKRAVEPLIRALSDSDESVRHNAARALGEINDPLAVPPLIRSPSDSDAPVRWHAAKALGQMGDRRALEPLRKLLDDPDKVVRDAARDAIRKIER